METILAFVRSAPVAEGFDRPEPIAGRQMR